MVFNMTSDQCVWAAAGVTGPTACINAFNCLDCPIDRKMQERVRQRGLAQGPGRNIPPRVKETLKRLPEDRRCRHMLSGRVAAKLCTYDFDCRACGFQQQMEDEAVNAQVRPIPSTVAAGFEVADRYYFHPNHTWARVEYGGRVRMGLDDFSARLLGPLDQIRLPELGTRLQKGSPGIGLSRNRFTRELAPPVQGVVVARNPLVLKQAGRVNPSPYQEGWLLVVEPLRLRADLKKLISGKESIAWMERESGRLAARLTGQTQYKLAATGGRAIPDIFGQLQEAQWDEMADEFLNLSQ